MFACVLGNCLNLIGDVFSYELHLAKDFSAAPSGKGSSRVELEQAGEKDSRVAKGCKDAVEKP